VPEKTERMCPIFVILSYQNRLFFTPYNTIYAKTSNILHFDRNLLSSLPIKKCCKTIDLRKDI